MRIPVKSRIGNAVLGVLGVIYTPAAVALLVDEIVQTWGAASMLDYAVMITLIAAAATGALFILTAVRNLGLQLPRREAQPRPEAAATAP